MSPGAHLHLPCLFRAVLSESLCAYSPERNFTKLAHFMFASEVFCDKFISGEKNTMSGNTHMFLKYIFSKALELQIKPISSGTHCSIGWWTGAQSTCLGRLSQLFYLVAVWPWATDLISLSLSFLILKGR